MKYVKLVIIFFVFLIISFVWVTIAKDNKITNYRTISGFEIKEYKIIDYDSSKGQVNIAIKPTSNAVECGLLAEESSIDFKKIEEDTCYLQNDLTPYKLYFKDNKNNISPEFIIDNFVVDIKLKDIYYLPLNSSLDLTPNIVKVNNPKIEVKSDNPNLIIENNIIKGNIEGTFKISIYGNDILLAETKVVITSVITEKPEMFNLDKPYLTCKEYNGEKAELIDEILNYRMSEVEYGTRASVVEAARFITMEFPRRIAYYWENGRLYKTGRHYVDGEGRYYHKGLYLSETKYKDIVATMQGPQMWGCKMINWQDDPPDFYRNGYYPNGLDCSGFVSWVLLNGGFDVGDKGAGPVGGSYDLTDLGDFRYMSTSLINSGLIKPGDLFSTNGHIAILIGIDDEHFYVAESLNHYGGVVMRKYNKKRVINFFQNVVLMDEVYKKDGKLTNLWF